MNWDWEKLQQQRRQKSPAGPGKPDFNSFNFDKFKKLNFSVLWIILGAAFFIWLLSGIYIIQPNEVGVVLRFGAFHRETTAGPHYHFPAPIETVEKVKNTDVFRAQIGLMDSNPRAKISQGESFMLTGDENIVDAKFIVQYKIKEPVKFLFQVNDVHETVKNAARAAMREVVGQNKIDNILTFDKKNIQDDCASLLQNIMDKYETGIEINAVQLQEVAAPPPVIDAFKDVASAREDKDRYIKEAETYSHNLVPVAEGQAQAIVKQAEAYKEKKIRQAEGQATRFLSVLKEYNQAKDVTRKRMYLETMEKIFSGEELEKIIITNEALKASVPYLPLSETGVRTKNKGSRQNDQK